MQNVVVMVVIVLCIAVLLVLFRMSYKMLTKVRHEERLLNAKQVPKRQLHPKLKQQSKTSQDQ